jgi:hypothetical protein
MAPDEMRMKYRSRCSYARKGHVIFSAENGVTGDVFKTFTRDVVIGGEKVVLPSINAAKRWVRANAPTTTFVV